MKLSACQLSILVLFITNLISSISALASPANKNNECYADGNFIITFDEARLFNSSSSQPINPESLTNTIREQRISERLSRGKLTEMTVKNLAEKYISGIRFVTPQDKTEFLAEEKPRLEDEGHSVIPNMICPKSAPVSGNLWLNDTTGSEKRIAVFNRSSKTVNIIGTHDTEVLSILTQVYISPYVQYHLYKSDIDADGIGDLILPTHELRARLKNNGQGHFILETEESPPSGPNAAPWEIFDFLEGDIDGDSIPDSVVAYDSLKSCNSSGSCSTILNNTLVIYSSKYVTPQLFTIPIVSGSYLDYDETFVADFNSDGRKDISMLIYGAHTILLQGNNGFFSQAPSTPSGYQYTDYGYTGDFNGDSLLDFVMQASIYGFDLFSGIGGAQFSSTNFWLAPLDPEYITKGDFNLDGYDDVLAYEDNYASGLGWHTRLQTAFGGPQGLTTSPSYTLPVSLNLQKGECLDIDFDGDQDCAFLSSNNQIKILRNDFANTGYANLYHYPNDVKSIGIDPSALTIIDPFALNEVTVSLVPSGGGAAIATTTTDSEGGFYFTSIPNGNYKLKGTKGSKFFFAPVDPNAIINVGSSPVTVNEPMYFSVPPPLNGTAISNDPGATWLWGLHNNGQKSGWLSDNDIDIPQAWSLTKGSPNLVVAVLDDGLDYTHPDLQSNTWNNPYEIVGNDIDDDGNGFIDDIHGANIIVGTGDPMPSDYHGTHIAGTIAATMGNNQGISGVAPNVKVMGVKVCDDTSCSLINQLNGFAYVADMSQAGVNVRVVNASFGGEMSCPSPMLSILQTLDSLGIVVAAAAGNSNSDNDQNAVSPAGCPVDNVISVASLTPQGMLSDTSNYGLSTVDLAAPGVDIWSTRTNISYAVSNGTSMAAPHVSGVAALLLSREPALTPSQVKQRLLSTVKLNPTLNSKMIAPGIVSANRALLNIQNPGNGGGTNPSPSPSLSPSPSASPSSTPNPTPSIPPNTNITGQDLADIAYINKKIADAFSYIEAGANKTSKRKKLAKKVSQKIKDAIDTLTKSSVVVNTTFSYTNFDNALYLAKSLNKSKKTPSSKKWDNLRKLVLAMY